MANPRYKRMFIPGRNTLPSMGDLRGKILVLDNADTGNYGINYKGSLTDIQDRYKVYFLLNDNPFGSGTVSLPQKARLVKEYIDKAERSTKVTINFLSGAVGMEPGDVARRINKDAYNHIGYSSGRKKRELGILVMDYPGDKLVYRIIKSNFVLRCSTRCPARTDRTQSDKTYAEFRIPASKCGAIIKINGGQYARYVFPKCHRATWTDLNYTCLSNGRWKREGSWDADAWCTSSNTKQKYLKVGNK